VDATGIEVFVDDRQRMRSAVAQLASTDFESRSGWARWAETRAEHYGDAELRSDGRALDAQALRAEGERPSAIEQPSVTWGIAKRGRARGVESPEPEALAHRALRQMLQGAKSEREVVAILSDARVFFPMAGATKAEGIERWQAAYQQSPADAYRSAPAAARAALDYMLIGDIQERLLRMRVGSLAPLERLKLIDEAEPLLGDRGSVVEGLRETALRELIADPGSLRQSDAFALAKHLREDLGRPDQSRAVLRGFLSWQRNRRLDANDATGRILLAGQFSELLEDRATAIELLQEAARLDIESKELADAFRRLGYVRSGSTFISSTSPPRGREGEPESGVARSRAPGGDPLTGLTPKEVRAQLGEPNAITRTATQGQIIEQWHYDEPKHQIIVISRRPGGTQGAVVGRYLVPR
jgi:tetratricopeptide (TPR) repeat protein